MTHYINDTTNKVYGYHADGSREMSEEEFSAFCNPAPTVGDCRCVKLAEMRVECGDHIDAGFDCAALGYECQYANTMKQQSRMKNSAYRVGGGGIWRNEAFTQHTQAQAQAVNDESISEIDRHTITYSKKCVYINDASRTAEEVLAVTWDSVE